jgi:oxygen-independent coproporphyrinogen-3 oxidase
VPGETLEQVEADLAEAVAFEPEHVSAYALSVEPGTPYARGVDRGSLVLPDEDLAVAMLEAIPERLGAAGIETYEISSHARPGFEAVHNRRYWERRPVLGLGMGAWSVEARSAAAPHGARRRNPPTLQPYLAAAGQPPAAEALERLDPATARGEAMFLGLRTREGVSRERFAAEFGAPPRSFYAAELDRLAGAGLLWEEEGGDVRLTHRGRLLSDTVFEAFVAPD